MATLYVDVATGDDTRSKATAANPATPWATIGRAAWGDETRTTPNAGEAAAAGDIVSIAAGTYVYTGIVDDRFDPVYNPVNSGSVGNPITFRANGTVILENPNAVSPIIGSNTGDYIVFDGHFYVDEVDNPAHPDTGPCVFLGVTGCEVDGAELVGIPGFDWGDNHNAVRLEGASSCTIKNCTLTDWYDGTGANGTLFTLYGCNACIIEHNRGDGAGVAVYFKDTAIQPPQLDNIVRFNYFSNVLNSFFRWSHVTAPADEDRSRVYQNLCIDGFIGINVIDATNDWVYNNTFVNCTGAGMSPGATALGIRAWNNIFENCAQMIVVDGATMPAASIWNNEHNVYHTFSGFYEGTDGTRDFANYLATYTDQDQATPASITSDPLFVNAGGSLATDYKLQVGSPAIDLGRDPDTAATINAGCYITGNEIIGPIPAIVLVQVAEDLTAPWTGDGAATATFPAPTTVGNVIVAVYGVSADLTFPSVTDDGSGGSNTYGQTSRSAFVATAGVTQIAYAAVERACSNVTVNASAISGAAGYLKIMEFSGLDVNNLLEAEAQDSVTVAAMSHPTGPVTTTIEASLLVGVLQGSSGTYTGTPGGFTEVYDQLLGNAAYKILSATTTESWTPTSASNETTTSSIAAFNGGSSSPPPPGGSVPAIVQNLRNQGIL